MPSIRLAIPVAVFCIAGCGARTEPLASASDASTEADVDLSPLGLSAAFYASSSTDPARTLASASGFFWMGDRQPRPGGGGPSYRLRAGESVSVNGVALQGGPADWGYVYQGHAIPPPTDGRWVFRFVIQGRSITREVVLRPVRWVDFPSEPVSIASGVTLRWEPALPEASTRRAYLTSCVLNERTEVGLSSARFEGRLSANPCLSHAQLSATVSAPLGAPFRDDSTIGASTGLDRELRVVP